LNILRPNKILDIIFFTIILVWVIGIFAEPLTKFIPELAILLPFLKYNYSLVCHTDPNKLFSIFDSHTLVCSRCLGIYLGGLLASIIFIFHKPKSFGTRILFYSSIPMFIDIIFYTLNIYHYSVYLAMLTGLLLGSVGFFYIHDEILKLFKTRT